MDIVTINRERRDNGGGWKFVQVSGTVVTVRQAPGCTGTLESVGVQPGSAEGRVVVILAHDGASCPVCERIEEEE